MLRREMTGCAVSTMSAGYAKLRGSITTLEALSGVAFRFAEAAGAERPPA